MPVTVVGAPGTVRGLADAVAEYEPVPAALTAAIGKSYDVPLVRPVTVADGAVDVPSANVTHAPGPVVVRRCTT